MGLKTTIGPNGVVTENVAGDSTVVMSVKNESAPINAVTFVSAAGNATVTGPFTFMNPSTPVTATLPSITAARVGTEYWVIKNSGSQPCMISASNAFDGGNWTMVMSGAYHCVHTVAVSGALGFYWQVLLNNPKSGLLGQSG